MFHFNLVMLGIRDKAIFLQSLCNICLVIFVYVGYGLGRVFWWFFACELGGQVLQLLTQASGPYLLAYLSQCRWMFWVRWLMYCLSVNGLLSLLHCYLLQSRISSPYLQLLCDDLKHCFAEFCLEYGKLAECATGSVVGSSVALLAGVQPWLIAPACASPFSTGSMMLPDLTETQPMFSLLVALQTMHPGFEAQDSFNFCIGFCFIPWQTGFPLDLRSSLGIVQFQIFIAGKCARYPIKHGWQQGIVVFRKATLILIVYLVHCLSSTYGIMTNSLPFYFYHMVSEVYVFNRSRLVCDLSCYCIILRKAIPHLVLYQVLIVSYGERIIRCFCLMILRPVSSMPSGLDLVQHLGPIGPLELCLSTYRDFFPLLT